MRRLGNFEFDETRSLILDADGQEHRLEPKVCKVLQCFLAEPSRQIDAKATQGALFAEAKRPDLALQVAISKLRRVFGNQLLPEAKNGVYTLGIPLDRPALVRATPGLSLRDLYLAHVIGLREPFYFDLTTWVVIHSRQVPDPDLMALIRANLAAGIRYYLYFGSDTMDRACSWLRGLNPGAESSAPLAIPENLKLRFLLRKQSAHELMLINSQSDNALVAYGAWPGQDLFSVAGRQDRARYHLDSLDPGNADHSEVPLWVESAFSHAEAFERVRRSLEDFRLPGHLMEAVFGPAPKPAKNAHAHNPVKKRAVQTPSR